MYPESQLVTFPLYIKDTVCAKLHKMKKNDKIFSQSNQQGTNLKNIAN